MSSTGLWPVAVINRYLSFFSLFRSNRDCVQDQLFASYEVQGGEYHGPEPKTTTRGKSREVVMDVTALSSEDEDSVDADFV